MEFLRLVFQHNKLYYQELDAIHEELTKNSIVNYLKVLKSQNIKKDQVNLDLIMKNSCEDVEKMLKILMQLVDDKNTVIKILEISDLDTVNYFKGLKEKNILTRKAFISYPNVFDPSSVERRILDRNISFMSTFKLNPTMFSKNPMILIENENLYMNLHVLKEYHLLDNLKDISKYKFLSKNNIEELIDKIIELGYEEMLEKDLSLLNEDNWDRIYVLKAMGLLPETKEELLKYLRCEKFFIDDKKLNLYMENASDYCKDLDVNYKVDLERIVKERETSPRALSFNGVIISRQRLVKHLNGKYGDINKFFKAILDDAILSGDEIETIKDDILEKTYKIG